MKIRDLKRNLASDNTYFKWKDGENRVRFVSEILPLWKAFAPDHSCTVYLTEGEAKKNKDAKKRFLVWGIDRATGAIQQIEFGASVMGQVLDLSETTGYEFDDVPKYDFLVKRSGSNMDTSYTVVAAREDTPLTPDEVEKVKSLEDLSRIVAKDAIDGDLYLSQPPF